MTYLEQLHQEHKERVNRMYSAGLPKVRPVEIKEAVDNAKIAVRIASTPEPRLKPVVLEIPEEESGALGDAPVQWDGLSTNQKLSRILFQAASAHGLSTTDLISKGRNAKLCAARFEYCYRAAMETTASLPRIGRLIQRDHTTILSAIGRYCDRKGLPYPRGAAWVCVKNNAERLKRQAAARWAAKKAARQVLE